jgi:hypothetical protein
MIRFAVVAGVLSGACLSPLFVQPVPQAQPQALQLAPVPHVPVEGYRPIRRIGQDGNALPGDEIRWGDVLPVFRDLTAQ